MSLAMLLDDKPIAKIIKYTHLTKELIKKVSFLQDYFRPNWCSTRLRSLTPKKT